MYGTLKLARRMSRLRGPNGARQTWRPAASRPPALLTLLALLAFGVGCSDDIVTEVPPEELAVAVSLGSAIGSALPAPLAQSTGTAFYVSPSGWDANPGTQSAPWKSISKALNTLRSGQRAYLRAGSYGSVSSPTTWSTNCSASAPCSLLAYQDEKPVIKGHFKVKGSYLRISGLVFEGPINGSTNQLWLDGAHHIAFEQNEVRFGNYHAGIKLLGVNNIQILNSYIHHNGRFSGSDGVSTDHGIYWASTSGPGNLIANNRIESNRARGISLHDHGTYDVILTGNTITNNGNTGLLINVGDRIRVVGNIISFNGHTKANRQIRIYTGNANVVERNVLYSPTAKLAGVENRTSSAVTGNVTADPLFVNRPGGNLHLRSGSPAIGLARPDYVTSRDLDGKPRDGAPDAGAYEY